MNCLFGNTGLVGSNIADQMMMGHHIKGRDYFQKLINTKNNDQFVGEFNDVVFCGARAEKWKANKNPQEDSNHINDLISKLSNIKCNKLYLISTIDVYDKTIPRQNEDNHAYTNETYGSNRRLLEQYCLDNFNCCVIRLPALFGKNLKKNFLFDVINKNSLEGFNPDSRFQWYNLKYISREIFHTSENKGKIINYFSESVSIRELLYYIGREDLLSELKGSLKVEYDFCSKHGLIPKQTILTQIKDFYEKNSMHHNNK